MERKGPAVGVSGGELGYNHSFVAHCPPHAHTKISFPIQIDLSFKDVILIHKTPDDPLAFPVNLLNCQMQVEFAFSK